MHTRPKSIEILSFPCKSLFEAHLPSEALRGDLGVRDRSERVGVHQGTTDGLVSCQNMSGMFLVPWGRLLWVLGRPRGSGSPAAEVSDGWTHVHGRYAFCLFYIVLMMLVRRSSVLLHLVKDIVDTFLPTVNHTITC